VVTKGSGGAGVRCMGTVSSKAPEGLWINRSIESAKKMARRKISGNVGAGICCCFAGKYEDPAVRLEREREESCMCDLFVQK
jgi:hypothetical protein